VNQVEVKSEESERKKGRERKARRKQSQSQPFLKTLYRSHRIAEIQMKRSR